MILIFIILVLPLLLLLYVLWAPFYLEVDSEQGRYRLRFHRLAYVWLNWEEVMPELWVKALWWQKQIDLAEGEKPKKVADALPHKPELKKKRGLPRWLQIKPTLAVLRSFSIDECYVDVDTDDVVMNGQLYPVLYLAGVTIGHPVRINFMGDNIIRLQVSNTLGRIAWAYLTNYKIRRHGKL